VRAEELGRRFRRRYPKLSLALAIILSLTLATVFAWRISDLAPDSISDWVFIALGASVAVCVNALWLQIAVLGRFGASESTRQVLRALLWLSAAFALSGSSWLYGVELPEVVQLLGASFGVALFVSVIPVEIAQRRRVLQAMS
jgi:hypothetical protein